MPVAKELLRSLRIEPGTAPALAERNPGDKLGMKHGDREDRLAHHVEQLGILHNRLFAEAKRSVLLVLQGMDASGKDGTIRHVFTGINPQGCRVVSFRQPSSAELAHDYLWRIHAVCPARGEIAIFNRSHYEDVVAVRVRKLVPERTWRRRFEHIRSFEQLLVDEGTTVVKVFLHVSSDEQRRRLEERLADPEKRWKFNSADLDARRQWDEFAAAYEYAIRETSTAWAPWYVVPADHNSVRNLAVAELLVAALEAIDPKLPEPELPAGTVIS